MKIRLLRNATLLLETSNKRLLVDPMLGRKGVLGPFPYTSDTRGNPLTDLPVSLEELKEILDSIDGVVLTHLHPDHWDLTAQRLIDKNIPIFCQPGDAKEIEDAGGKTVIEVHENLSFGDLEIFRTNGKHGEGEIGNLMGKVSGFVFKTEVETIYIAGDTIWCNDVQEAIQRYKPNKIIINGGGAQFEIGDHVTMNRTDLIKMYNFYPYAHYYVVHLDAVSPVKESREEIQAFIVKNKLTDNFVVPNDGDYF